MPSEIQPTPKDDLQSDRIPHVRHRSSVRTLLGMPDGESTGTIFPIAMPPLTFSYVVLQGVPGGHEPGQLPADELFRWVPLNEPAPNPQAHEHDVEHMVAQEAADGELPPEEERITREKPLSQRHGPGEIFADEAGRSVASSAPAPSPQLNEGVATDRIGRRTADRGGVSGQEIMASEVPPSEVGAIDQQTTITIPGVTERRPPTPMSSPSTSIPLPADAMQTGHAEAPPQAPTTHWPIEAASAEGSSQLPHDRMRGGAPSLDEDPAGLREGAGREAAPTMMPRTGGAEGLSTDAARGAVADAPAAPQSPVSPELVARATSGEATGDAPMAARRPEPEAVAVPTPSPAANPRPDASPGRVMPAGHRLADQVERRQPSADDPTVPSVTAWVPTGQAATEGFVAAPHTPTSANAPGIRRERVNSAVRQSPERIGSLPPAGSPLAMLGDIAAMSADSAESWSPIAAAPIPVADARPTDGPVGRTSPPLAGLLEQLAQLQRKVSELAAQIGAQQAAQQANLQVNSASPPPAQPVVIVKRSTPQSMTPRAFWERSYLGRLARWPRR